MIKMRSLRIYNNLKRKQSAKINYQRVKEFFSKSHCLLQKLKFCFLIMLFCSSKLYALQGHYSTELEKLEKEFIEIINRANNIFRDPLANQYLTHLGNKLANMAALQTAHFFIVNSDDINAFAGPGNYIGVNTQLILATDSEDELAGVIAHEIAHLRLNHLYNMIEHQKLMQIPMLASILASIALGLINPTLAGGALMASLTGFTQDNINFIRSNEKEADRIGMEILIKCGFNPYGTISFFQKLQQNSRYYYSDIPAILRTHPLDEDRIAEAQNRLPEKFARRIPINQNYFLFKELIRVNSYHHKQLLEYYQNNCGAIKKHPNCDFGSALFLIKTNQFQAAISKLGDLLKQDPNNLFYQLSMAEAEIGDKQVTNALSRLKALNENEPDNYAIIRAYGDKLITSGQYKDAAKILLKGFRIFNKDYHLCTMLAQAEAKINRKSYAYFIQAQCLLLQGRHKDALKKLDYAKKLAQNDQYLTARINAVINQENSNSGRDLYANHFKDQTDVPISSKLCSL